MSVLSISSPWFSAFYDKRDVSVFLVMSFCSFNTVVSMRWLQSTTIRSWVGVERGGKKIILSVSQLSYSRLMIMG